MPTPSSAPDTIFIRSLLLKVLTGHDAWKRPKPQPVSVSVSLRSSLALAGATDHLHHSLNYAIISRNITELLESPSSRFKSLDDISIKVANEVLDESKNGGQWAKIQISCDKALLRAKSLEIIIVRQKDHSKNENFIKNVDGISDLIKINKLILSTIIGVFTFERREKQNIIIDLELEKPKIDYSKFDIHLMINDVTKYIENSQFKTVEALVTSVAQLVCQHGIETVRVRVEKPSAITFADGVGVEIIRSKQFFDGWEPIDLLKLSHNPQNSIQLFPDSNEDPEDNVSETSGIFQPSKIEFHKAFIAFGTNQGNPHHNILRAYEELNKKNITVVATSSLYESEPMYVTNQPKFINGVFEVKTTLEPLELLDELQDIESNILKRIKLIDKGPRTIDLDILLYDKLILNHSRLIIPHIGIVERSFVLQPLCELLSPSETHPLTAETFHSHLHQLPKSNPSLQLSSKLFTAIPIVRTNETLQFDPLDHTLRTYIMGILNVTPDSFSDGGNNIEVSNLIKSSIEMVDNGADIIDIGGVSTKPGSSDPGLDEELRRVIPAVKAIRSSTDERLQKVLISIDTYRSEVAKQSIEAGADIINDISGGTYDKEMFSTIGKLNVPIIINHTRGTPSTMDQLAHYENLIDFNDISSSIEYIKINHNKTNDNLHHIITNNDLSIQNSDYVVATIIARELLDRVEEAFNSGVKKWQIILDPGIGFAKNLKQNLSIIRKLPLITNYSRLSCIKNDDIEDDAFSELTKYTSLNGLPILLGPSRKKFIGTITNEPIPKDRVIGTAATITACIGNGSDIIRVHDVKEMTSAAKIADAIYKDIV